MFHAFTSVRHIYSTLTCLSVISVIITRNLTAPCIHVSSSHLLYTCLLVSHLCHYNTQSQCSMHSRQFITSTLCSLACQSSLSLWHAISMFHAFTSVPRIYSTLTCLSVISVIITRNLNVPCIHISSSHLLYAHLLVSHLCHCNTQSQCSVHSHQFVTSTLHSLSCQSSLSL